MSIQPGSRRPQAAARQGGQAMLLTVLLLATGITAIIYNFATPAKQSIERGKITAAALAQAKDSLIGYAANDPTQPGTLPCPDNNNDGDADSPCGVLGTTAIGRLPWKTLGLPDLRDGSGECLWYAVSANFKNSSGSGPATLNSDSLGTLIINDSTGTAVLSGSDAALAIVFAPGAPLPSQNRAPGAASVCGGNTNAANYLDSQTVGGTTFNNATGGGTNNFIAASPSPQPTELNDKLMPITRGALFPVVEIRVARELRTSLRSYYTANQFYPLSAALPNNTATSGTYRGYVPTATTPSLLAPDLAPYLPAWFTANNWQQFMVYAVAPRCTARLVPTAAPTAIDAPSLNCNNTADGTPPGSWLTVSGTGGIHSAVLPASYRLGAQARPCAGFADCLEVVGASNENIDAVDNYTYVKPVRSAVNNDNLVVVAPP